MEMIEQETHTMDMNKPPVGISEMGDDGKAVESKDPVSEFLEKIDKQEAKDAKSIKEDGNEGAEDLKPAKEGKSQGEKGAELADEGKEAPEPHTEGGFKPDLSYTFRGKKFDMPSELAGLIDSPEKQTFYEDLFTKAKGLEIVKAEGLKAQENYQALSQDIGQFLDFTQKKDYAKAFERAGIERPNLSDLVRGFGFSDRDLITLAYERAQMKPEQVQAEQALYERDRQIKELQMQQSQMRTQQEQVLMSQTQAEFEQVFQDPKVVEIVQKFDEKHGDGAFLNECLMRGEQLWQMEKKFVRPQALVKEFIDRYNLGNLASQPVQEIAQGSPQVGTQSQPARSKKKESIPVIPAIEGSGDSPGERKIRTLDDIKAILHQEYGGSAW